MTLDILVCHYNEPLDYVRSFLSSVDSQDDLDGVRVVICNDGSEVPVTFDLIEGHEYEVSYIESARGGLSHTRNVLLDEADADYVMLCDIDDHFLDDGSVGRLKSLCDGCDVVQTDFVKRYANGTWDILPHDVNLVHGKAFRREFVAENGIRFADDLVMASDGYFLTQTSLLSGSTVTSNEPLYVWEQREGSVSHRDRDFVVVNHWYAVEANGLLAERFSDRRDLHGMFVARLVHGSYLRMHSDRWAAHAEEFGCRFAMRTLAWWLKRYYREYLSLPEGGRRHRYEVTLASSGLGDPGFDGIGEWARDVMECVT